MSDDKPTGEQVAHGIIAQGRLADLKFYLDRGRALEGLSEVQLQERLVEAARAWAAAPFEPQVALDDVRMEYGLRKVEPPLGLVRDDLERAIAVIVARGEQMTDEERDAANAAMIADHEKNSRSRN